MCPMVAKLESPPKTADAPIEVTPGGWPDRELVQIASERNTHVVIGRVVHVHVDPSVWKYASVIRASGARFDQ